MHAQITCSNRIWMSLAFCSGFSKLPSHSFHFGQGCPLLFVLGSQSFLRITFTLDSDMHAQITHLKNRIWMSLAVCSGFSKLPSYSFHFGQGCPLLFVLGSQSFLCITFTLDRDMHAQTTHLKN